MSSLETTQRIDPELGIRLRRCREEMFRETRDAFALRLSEVPWIAEPISVKQIEHWERAKTQVPGSIRYFLAQYGYWEMKGLKAPNISEEKIGALRNALRQYEEIQKKLVVLISEAEEKWKEVSHIVTG